MPNVIKIIITYLLSSLYYFNALIYFHPNSFISLVFEYLYLELICGYWFYFCIPIAVICGLASLNIYLESCYLILFDDDIRLSGFNQSQRYAQKHKRFFLLQSHGQRHQTCLG